MTRQDVVLVATVDVIVPVYRGLEETRRCLESVLHATSTVSFELVVVDDAGPEPALASYLDALAEAGRITLKRNEANLGFVGTVNRGMALHPDRDVVLLNSDTEVANDWLDRLRACAYRQARTATVTPFSNNATICSYPLFCEDNMLPDGVSLTELDQVFARVNEGEALEIPTAVGFCMYIRRACLDEVGPFDADLFRRGYGEENDFSRRAAKAGWRNLLCADVFVRHAGGVSFGADKAALLASSAKTLAGLHPEYEGLVGQFIQRDAPARFRHAVDVELARRRRTRLSSVVTQTGAARLHVVHDLGGGIERWCDDFRRGDAHRTSYVLKPVNTGGAYGESRGLAVFGNASADVPLGYWPFTRPIHSTAVSHDEYGAALAEIVEHLGIGTIMVSSLIGHALDVLETGLPTLVICHDYYPLCPAINMFFGGVCTSCDDGRLRDCAARNPEFNPPHRLYPVDDRVAVRHRFVAAIRRYGITLVAPSPSTRDNYLNLAPDLADAPFAVIPHGYGVPLMPVRHRFETSEQLKIVVLGIQATSKGAHMLLAGLEQMLAFAELYLVGAREAGEWFRHRAGVHVVDNYTIEQLPGIIEDIQPDLGLLTSIWPETYSYTLTELMALGIPVAATRMGAFADRVRDEVTGFLFEPDTVAMLACLRRLAGERGRLHAVRANLLALSPRLSAEMVADYDGLLPESDPKTASVPVVGQEGLVAYPDAACLASLHKETASLRLRLELRGARQQEMARELAGTNAKSRALEDRLIQESEAAGRRETDLWQSLQAREQEVGQLRASTSWRVSLPVRWLGRGFWKLRAWLTGSH